jgi:hypothetical protein
VQVSLFFFFLSERTSLILSFAYCSQGLSARVFALEAVVARPVFSFPGLQHSLPAFPPTDSEALNPEYRRTRFLRAQWAVRQHSGSAEATQTAAEDEAGQRPAMDDRVDCVRHVIGDVLPPPPPTHLYCDLCRVPVLCVGLSCVGVCVFPHSCVCICSWVHATPQMARVCLPIASAHRTTSVMRLTAACPPLQS